MLTKRIIVTFLILFILAAGAGVAFAQENATDDFCVGDKNTDEVQTQSNDVVLTQEGSFDDIKTKIEDAEVGSTVSIEGTYKCSGYYIDITKPLTLDGNNRTILDCNHVYGALSLQSDNITIKNLKIVNSNFTAISIGANNILIENCEFINNYPIYYGSGGAISSISIMDTNNITVKNSIFTQNSNAVQIMGRDIFIINSTFIDNTEYAMSLFGLNQYVDNCRFINNSGGLYYGGISLYSNVDFESDGSEKFIVKNSIFSNNTQNAIKYVISSEINPDFIVNEAFIDNCSFTNNSADVYGSGGAIYFSSSNNYGIHSKLTVSNSRFENNRAVNNGGAINAISRDSKIINCNFTNCNVKENGGALALYGDNFTVENSRFTNNKAYFDEIYYSDIGGGAIFYSGLDLKVSGSVFENSLASKGGAILAELYEYSTGKYGLLSIEKSTFTQNHAKIAGSIYCDYEGSINVDSSDFIKNSAEISSTITLKGKATITNSKFINNTASFVAMELLGDAVLDKNTYLNNNYGMFVLKDGKIYDENMKRMDLITFNAPAVKTEYNSGKVFTVTLTHSFTGAPIHDAAIDIYDANTNKVLLGGVTDSNGVATFDIDLKVGTYNVKIYLISNIYHTWRSTLSFAHSYYPDPVSSKIVVTKISTKTKAPKITAKFKKSKNFKITVTHGKSPVKKVKLKIKIGKKTYKATTNGKGIAKFNVKKLKVGKHKVVISSGNANYKISAKSKITIKK